MGTIPADPLWTLGDFSSSDEDLSSNILLDGVFNGDLLNEKLS